jgi:hypothetical protein
MVRKVVQPAALFFNGADILELPVCYVSSISFAGFQFMGDISYRFSSLFSARLGTIEAFFQTSYA